MSNVKTEILAIMGTYYKRRLAEVEPAIDIAADLLKAINDQEWDGSGMSDLKKYADGKALELVRAIKGAGAAENNP